MKNKKDILFIGLHRPNRSPSQRYRIEQFLPYLDKKEVSYDYAFLLDQKMDKIFYSPKAYIGKAWIVLQSFFKLFYITFFISKNYKTIFVQREAFMLGTAFFEKQMAKRAYLVFDFDDSIWMQNVSQANRKLAFLKNADKTKEIIQQANLVIVGNQYLKDYALRFNKNVEIIPTCIDTNEYSPSRTKGKTKTDAICIGWSGSQTTIEHFKLLLPVLLKLKELYQEKVYFKVMGDSSYENDQLGIKGIAWNRITEIQELNEIDIGVMPLPQDEWSKGKCGLKALVYMSMEIPAVIENHGVNGEIVSQNENGILCGNEKEWMSSLSRLIENELLRKEIGLKGRKRVLDTYSILANQELFLKLLQHEKA